MWNGQVMPGKRKLALPYRQASQKEPYKKIAQKTTY